MISYEGLFFEGESLEIIRSLEEKTLAKCNDNIHCTFRYHPTKNEIFDEIVGQTFEVTLIEYGNDDKNSGFKVSLPDELISYYINYDNDNNNLRIPHITSSISENAEPSATKDLDFKPLKNPCQIKGRFGYLIKTRDGKYISFEKYKNS